MLKTKLEVLEFERCSSEAVVSMQFKDKSIEGVCRELQVRLGALPLVRMNESKKQLRLAPTSLAEICRIVRACRTMRLRVRACGQETGCQECMYADDFSVLIECHELLDAPRISLVQMRRTGLVGEVEAVRVLAGTPFRHCVRFLVKNHLQLRQGAELLHKNASLVGALVNGAAGNMRYQDPYYGACLADEVLGIRIVNNEGNLVTYTSDEELRFAVRNLGVLGIVYDVYLRCQPMSVAKVTYEYWSSAELLNVEKLDKKLKENSMVELTYIPFNSCESVKAEDWDPMQDHILLRQVTEQRKETEEPIDADARLPLHLCDPIYGPHKEEYEAATSTSSLIRLMKRSFVQQQRLFLDGLTVKQYLPWTFNALTPPPFNTRFLCISIPLGENMHGFDKVSTNTSLLGSFVKVMQRMADCLKCESIRDGALFPVMLGLRIHFTRQSLLDVADVLKNELILAHLNFITFDGIAQEEWQKFCEQMYKALSECSAELRLGWNSDWPQSDEIRDRMNQKFRDQTHALAKEVQKLDRDGMFLNDFLQSNIFSTDSVYRQIYHNAYTNVSAV